MNCAVCGEPANYGTRCFNHRLDDPYTPTTAEVRHKWAFEEGDVYESAAEFDRWYVQEIEKAEYSGYLRAVREGLHR